MHALMHSCMYSCIHVCIHAFSPACFYSFCHACIYGFSHSCIQSCMHSCIPSARSCSVWGLNNFNDFESLFLKIGLRIVWWRESRKRMFATGCQKLVQWICLDWDFSLHQCFFGFLLRYWRGELRSLSFTACRPVTEITVNFLRPIATSLDENVTTEFLYGITFPHFGMDRTLEISSPYPLQIYDTVRTSGEKR